MLRKDGAPASLWQRTGDSSARTAGSYRKPPAHSSPSGHRSRLWRAPRNTASHRAAVRTVTWVRGSPGPAPEPAARSPWAAGKRGQETGGWAVGGDRGGRGRWRGRRRTGLRSASARGGAQLYGGSRSKRRLGAESAFLKSVRRRPRGGQCGHTDTGPLLRVCVPDKDAGGSPPPLATPSPKQLGHQAHRLAAAPGLCKESGHQTLGQTWTSNNGSSKPCVQGVNGHRPAFQHPFPEGCSPRRFSAHCTSEERTAVFQVFTALQ